MQVLEVLCMNRRYCSIIRSETVFLKIARGVFWGLAVDDRYDLACKQSWWEIPTGTLFGYSHGIMRCRGCYKDRFWDCMRLKFAERKTAWIRRVAQLHDAVPSHSQISMHIGKNTVIFEWLCNNYRCMWHSINSRAAEERSCTLQLLKAVWSSAASPAHRNDMQLHLSSRYMPWPCRQTWLRWKFTPLCVSVLLANRSPPNFWTGVGSPHLHSDYASEIICFNRKAHRCIRNIRCSICIIFSMVQSTIATALRPRLNGRRVYKAISRIVASSTKIGSI